MSAIDHYLLYGERTVQGWLSPYTAEFIAALGEIQVRLGMKGSVGEIGVHHGKLFVLLCLILAPDEHGFAIDLFEDQALNIDGSGRGDRDILMDNLRRWCPDTLRSLSVLSKSSLDTTPGEILTPCGPARLISIDGGHTAECVHSDLKLSEAVMTPACIVALDAYFNEDWPDVSTGASRYIMEPSSRLRPFAVTPNKVFFADSEHCAVYRDRIATETSFRPYKTSRMFGCDVDVYHGYPAAPPVSTYLRERLRQSVLGPHLLRIKRSVFGYRR